MSFQAIKEAERYANELLPMKSDIYKNGSSIYSNARTVVLKRETTVPFFSSEKCGILPEVKIIWYTSPNKLHLYRYDRNDIEEISDFSSNVQFVRCFVPTAGIFNSRVSHCILVITENECIIYGVESQAFTILNTEFSVKLSSKVNCVEISNGNIYLGCNDNNVYQALYKTIDIFNYKHMALYCPASFISKTLSSIFTRKEAKIIQISVGKKILAALSKSSIQVFSIDGGIYKAYSISTFECYASIQIIEEDPLLLCCTRRDGMRDFFGKELLFSKDFPLLESTQINQEFYSTSTKFLSVRKSPNASLFVLASFNIDQLRNFSKIKPVENYETITVNSPIKSLFFNDSQIIILCDNKIIEYEIFDSKKIIQNCKSQDVYQVYKNFGDIEFLIRYYQLLTEGEDTTKLEGMCKNESIRNHALFIWLYHLVKPIWSKDLYSLKLESGSQDADIAVEETIKKLTDLKSRLGSSFEEARAFIDLFVQTNFYVNLLVEYNISFRESFESILTTDTTFKNDTLKAILDMFSMNHNMEKLIKTMKNSCPLYLPIEQINLQMGLELLNKGNREAMLLSLDHLKHVKFDQSIIKKYNLSNFYYGSTYLIKEKFNFTYEEAVVLLSESIKCRKAFDLALSDNRESFLYPCFEAILNLKEFTKCACCESLEPMVDLIKIDNPLFKIFLKDSKNEKATGLYWKYLLYRNNKIEAVEALISLSQRSDLDIKTKAEFLQKALSVSTGTHLNAEIKIRLRLFSIQQEMMSRSKLNNITQILSADALYNDYCYQYYDLSIKILDIINFQNLSILKDLYSKYFKDKSLSECLNFLKDIQNKNLGLVIDLLVEKLDSSDFCKSLSAAGFEHKDIVSHVRSIIMSHGHPNIKQRLLSSLQEFADPKDYSECKKYCEDMCGIKANK